MPYRAIVGRSAATASDRERERCDEAGSHRHAGALLHPGREIRQAANANEIIQTPGQVVLINEAYHNFRVIPVDGRPACRRGSRSGADDARGRWEGNTLVLEVTNLNGKNHPSVTTANFFAPLLGIVKTLHVSQTGNA